MIDNREFKYSRLRIQTHKITTDNLTQWLNQISQLMNIIEADNRTIT